MLKIKEDPKIKVKLKNIHIKVDKDFSFSLYCPSFEALESIYLKIYSSSDNLKIYFPIFDGKCNIIFKSLKYFYFHKIGFSYIHYDTLLNLYNNIDKMPNLVDFSLDFLSNENDLEKFKKIYKNFLKKILFLKDIKRINIIINDETRAYSKSDIKSIFPDININKFYEVNIYKFAFDLCITF